MKQIVHIGLGWDRRKPPEELQRDKARVREILEKIGLGYLFREDQHFYDLELKCNSVEFENLVKELQATPHLAAPATRVERIYTKRELLEAELLWLIITGTVGEGGDTYGTQFDPAQICPHCGTGFVQISDLVIDKGRMGKKDLATTYEWEVVLSERVARLLREQPLTGYELRPVRHYARRKWEKEPVLSQLMATHTLPPMASPPTEFEKTAQYCLHCGRNGLYLKSERHWGALRYWETSEVYYHRQGLEIQDFNQTYEHFGQGWPMRGILISPRVYRLLLEHKVRNYKVKPVYIID
jgi:hypothetical protein